MKKEEEILKKKKRELLERLRSDKSEEESPLEKELKEVEKELKKFLTSWEKDRLDFIRAAHEERLYRTYIINLYRGVRFKKIELNPQGKIKKEEFIKYLKKISDAYDDERGLKDSEIEFKRKGSY